MVKISLKKPSLLLDLSRKKPKGGHLTPLSPLTLFDMGKAMMPPPKKKRCFDHCAQTLRRRKLKLGDF